MIRSLLLALTAATIAANLYSKSRRRQMAADASRQQAFAGAPQALDELERTRADSPNAGERLRASNLTGSPIGAGTPLAEQHESDELFGSSSQQGPLPMTTGLPDYSRGA